MNSSSHPFLTVGVRSYHLKLGATKAKKSLVTLSQCILKLKKTKAFLNEEKRGV